MNFSFFNPSPDQSKTTSAYFFANALTSGGSKVAFLDGDIQNREKTGSYFYNRCAIPKPFDCYRLVEWQALSVEEKAEYQHTVLDTSKMPGDWLVKAVKAGSDLVLFPFAPSGKLEEVRETLDELKDSGVPYAVFVSQHMGGSRSEIAAEAKSARIPLLEEEIINLPVTRAIMQAGQVPQYALPEVKSEWMKVFREYEALKDCAFEFLVKARKVA